jgi:hypothetical protein
MAGLVWKKIVAKYDGRDITAQYARDGEYVRVSFPGKAEERMKHRKQRAEPLARGLLVQWPRKTKVACVFLAPTCQEQQTCSLQVRTVVTSYAPILRPSPADVDII